MSKPSTDPTENNSLAQLATLYNPADTRTITDTIKNNVLNVFI